MYNKVRDIDEVTSRIQELVPEANVAFAHGQMQENQLEDIMYRFINGDIDVLVSTTIIETGLDISNVNTMIIHDADNMGLSPAVSAARAGRQIQSYGVCVSYVPQKQNAQRGGGKTTGCHPGVFGSGQRI